IPRRPANEICEVMGPRNPLAFVFGSGGATGRHARQVSESTALCPLPLLITQVQRREKESKNPSSDRSPSGSPAYRPPDDGKTLEWGTRHKEVLVIFEFLQVGEHAVSNAEQLLASFGKTLYRGIDISQPISVCVKPEIGVL